MRHEIDIHTILHDCLAEGDHFDVLKVEFSRLSDSDQALLLLEGGRKVLDYVNINQMGVDLLGYED